MDEARLVAAESSLRTALERELAAPARLGDAAGGDEVGATRSPARPAARPGASWWDGFLAPAWKPALAMAGVIVVVAGVLMWPRLDGRPGEPVLRGEAPANRLAIVMTDRGARGVELRWSPIPEADLYEVRMFSESLEEIGRIGTADTSLVFSPDRLPEGQPKSGTLLLRVIALRGGDELASSDVQTVERP